ncbi:hypothetical protein [Snodgrassella sp. CFCC 13594]|uniref:hypothetical protein n=1 Tax=Snodgrassella sp. CFCC 13594 TaxID=1775559 RepID=UPI0008319CEA|nr:hypothetical protein [Snodgrassella sp. CFCC 13594]
MARVTIELIDIDNGVFVKVGGAGPTAEDEKPTKAQELAFFALKFIDDRYKRATGRDAEKTTLC